MEQIIVKKAKKHVLADHFLKILKESGTELHSLYYHIFSITTKKELEYTLKFFKSVWAGKDSNYGSEGKEYWFTAFHKSIRQTDFFNDSYRYNKTKTLTKSENSEYYFLLDKVTKEHYDKKGDSKNLFNDEYSRFLELSEKKRQDKREISIGGHLDMILWNTIHVDKKNVLYDAFVEVFENK